jgi:hypothetical protein
MLSGRRGDGDKHLLFPFEDKQTKADPSFRSEPALSLVKG